MTNSIVMWFDNFIKFVTHLPGGVINFKKFVVSLVTLSIIFAVLFVFVYIGYSMSVGWRAGNYKHTILYYNSYYEELAQSMKSVYLSMKELDTHVDVIQKIVNNVDGDADTNDLFNTSYYNAHVQTFVSVVDNAYEAILANFDKKLYSALLAQHNTRSIVGDIQDITTQNVRENLFPLLVELMKVDNMRYQRMKQPIQVYPSDIQVDIRNNVALRKLLGDINSVNVPMMWPNARQSLSAIGRVFDAYMAMADNTKDETNFLTMTTHQFYKDGPTSTEFFNIVSQTSGDDFMNSEEFKDFTESKAQEAQLYYADFLQVDVTDVNVSDWKSIIDIALKNKTPVPPKDKFTMLMRLRVIQTEYDRLLKALKIALMFIDVVPLIAPHVANVKINIKVAAMFRDTYRGPVRPDNKSRDMTPDNYNVYPCVKPWEYWINFFIQMWEHDFGGNCGKLLGKYWKFVRDLWKNCLYVVRNLIPMDRVKASTRSVKAFARISPNHRDSIWNNTFWTASR